MSAPDVTSDDTGAHADRSQQNPAATAGRHMPTVEPQGGDARGAETTQDVQSATRPPVEGVPGHVARHPPAQTHQSARSGKADLASPALERRQQRAERYAALDLGTNNCRLLIAEPRRRGFRVIDAFSRIIRLGEGLSRTGRLSDGAIERAVEALDICRAKLEDKQVWRMRLIATEACRSAENGEEFLQRVTAETGLDLTIVDRKTEARLAVAGCATLVEPDADGVILFDIGGGSSEIVWLDLRRRQNSRPSSLSRCIRSWASLPVGVVSLSERHGGVEVTPPVFEAMVADVDAMLDDMAEGAALAKSIANGRVHMLGTSGTVTTLAGVYLGLERYDRRRVDGAWMTDAQVDAMIREICAMSYPERVANPCIGADRADLVLAGCAILEALRRRWPCDRLRVADRGLREGMLVEMMLEDKVWRRRGRNQRRRYRQAPSNRRDDHHGEG